MKTLNTYRIDMRKLLDVDLAGNGEGTIGVHRYWNHQEIAVAAAGRCAYQASYRLPARRYCEAETTKGRPFCPNHSGALVQLVADALDAADDSSISELARLAVSQPELVGAPIADAVVSLMQALSDEGPLALVTLASRLVTRPPAVALSCWQRLRHLLATVALELLAARDMPTGSNHAHRGP